VAGHETNVQQRDTRSVDDDGERAPQIVRSGVVEADRRRDVSLNSLSVVDDTRVLLLREASGQRALPLTRNFLRARRCPEGLEPPTF